MEFNARTREQIGWYVYCLTDLKGIPFYIGKGKDNRIFAHMRDVLGNKAKSSDKLDKIREIVAQGKTPGHYIIRRNIKDEETAYELESILIDIGKKFSSYGLKNAIRGLGATSSGIINATDLAKKLQASPLKEFENNAMIVNVNNKYKQTQNYYKAAKEAWAMSEARTKTIKYVMAEYQSLIEEVFEVDNWYSKQSDGKKRWCFEGKVAPTEIRNKYIDKRVIKKKGDRNPIRYGRLKNTLIDTGEKSSSINTEYAVRKRDAISPLIMKIDEQIGQYKACRQIPLKELQDDAMIVNINYSYQKTRNCYEAARRAWPMSEKRTETINFVLAEYRGFIVDVFKVHSWHKIPGHKRMRWGFKGDTASIDIKNTYIGKLVVKKRGDQSPIRYNL